MAVQPWDLSRIESPTSLGDCMVMTVNCISTVSYPTCFSSAIYPFPAGFPRIPSPDTFFLSKSTSHPGRPTNTANSTNLKIKCFLLRTCSSIPYLRYQPRPQHPSEKPWSLLPFSFPFHHIPQSAIALWILLLVSSWRPSQLSATVLTHTLFKCTQLSLHLLIPWIYPLFSLVLLS